MKKTFLANTYRTFSGVKEILETPEKKETEWVIYQDNQPKYFVEFVLDDRNQVVDLWRKDLNLPCLQVNYGNI